MPTILADEWALTKALTNLLGNALQYADPDRRPTVRVACEDEGSTWAIRVRDNGIGIPAKDRDRLFRRFERGSNTGGISGTGLGLHIVKEIAAGHGGSVAFESVEGHGTEFIVRIPKEPAQPEHSPLTETAARADL
jgi:signal transduction histidine kinase